MNEDKHLITKMIIGPFESNPKGWTEKIIYIHNRLVESMGETPYAVLSNHCNRLAGCYGSPKNKTQFERGIRSHLGLIGRLAMEPENELYILLEGEGFSELMKAEYSVWYQVREDLGLEPNIRMNTWESWERILL